MHSKRGTQPEDKNLFYFFKLIILYKDCVEYTHEEVYYPYHRHLYVLVNRITLSCCILTDPCDRVILTYISLTNI